jgi:hypothetical protein
MGDKQSDYIRGYVHGQREIIARIRDILEDSESLRIMTILEELAKIEARIT